MYPPNAENDHRINAAFSNKAPRGDQAQRCAQVREDARRFAQFLAKVCPDSPELSHALTRLEESVSWAQAAITRHE